MMKRILAALCALILCGAAMAAQAEKTVGAEITEQDVTEFYYTVDDSAYPPYYLRYRFYTEDGKRLFDHEARQGGGWPQTEEDAVWSGTVELTEADWSAFMGCLEGGAVRARSSSDVTGDAGPWTYLYWTGDRGDVQAFSFASPARRGEFEALCASLAENHVLTRFSLSRWGEMAPASWEMTRRKDGCFLQENDEAPIPFADALAAELQQAIEAYGVEAWNGFNETETATLDGECFSIECTYADGSGIRAFGNNAFPEGYFEAMEAMEAVLQKAEAPAEDGTLANDEHR